jgi:hypothetical protein
MLGERVDPVVHALADALPCGTVEADYAPPRRVDLTSPVELAVIDTKTVDQ